MAAKLSFPVSDADRSKGHMDEGTGVGGADNLGRFGL